MPKKTTTQKQLLVELEGLRARLDEAKETLRAIRGREVDALVVPSVGGDQVFTLKDADHAYRILIEEMSEGALTVTAEGLILYANRRFAEMLKTLLEKVIGSTIHTWIAPDSQPILQSLLRKGVDEKRRAQLALTAGDGTRVPVYLSVSKLPMDEMPDSFCLVATDLTEQKRGDAIVASEKLAQELLAAANQSRLVLLSMIEDQKQTEEALRESEMRYRAVVHSANDAIINADSAGITVGWNPGAERIFGYTEVEICGQPLTLLLPAHYNEGHLAGMARVQTGGEPHIIGKTVEMEGLRKGGSEFPLEISLAGWQVADEKFYTAIIRDITQRKQAEESLRATLTDLQRSNADLQQFAYVASHDLQEPLRMVASYVQLLAMRYQGQLDADADDFIGYALEGAKRMQQLLLDLLEYSRVGTRGAPLQPTDAAAVCQTVLRDLELAIAENHATVACDPLPTVLADLSQLAQLFQNLIANAIKFHGAEPPHVHISARETFEVSETLRQAQGRLSKVSAKVWEFAVHDNGIGIDPAYFERIFVIFQRLHTRDAYPGTGIGLAVCKRIIERHGGSIWVESAPGQGATFFFTLPAAT